MFSWFDNLRRLARNAWSIVNTIWLVMLLALVFQPAYAESGQGGYRAGTSDTLPAVSLAGLPPEAMQTLRAIKQGGPFEYERDGVVFKNYERILPKRSRGYYHEYTVKTPGKRSRGARRIISGQPGEYYYSADHYQTFYRIRE